MISSSISFVSIALLSVGGAFLLFASDHVLPALVPGFPRNASFFGQLVSAAWFGVAMLNWLQRGAILGGIYGRPIVLANFTLYFITATVLVRPLLVGAASGAWWIVFAPAMVMTIAYGALMLRGPFDPLGQGR